jgi:RHS repeat-associated protein
VRKNKSVPFSLPNGNITSDGRHTYQYNEQNQLHRVLDGQTVLGEYTYNAKGQRVKKVAGGTTIYHYDLMGNLIQETDGSGNIISSYVYAGTHSIAKVESSGAIYYYHNDHLGTPLAMTDATGAIVWKAAYNPFGKAEVDQSSTITNNFRFPGQYYDSESGLHYNWYRYYDPGTGRYVTADLIGIQEGENHLYWYVKNNPVNYTDLLGLVWFGNWCGPGGSGNAQNCVDQACKKHDRCYEKCKLDALTRWINIASLCALQCDFILLYDINNCHGEICH